jgi:Arc/MetJ-type ribon-helix-helix transcriptional regulator
MTIEVKPETSQRLQKEIQSGYFHNLDELLAQALDALHERRNVRTTRPERSSAEVVAHIREIRKGVSLSGLTTKELRNEGRP